MADDTDITGGPHEGRPADVDVTELAGEETGGWWPPQPAVIIIFGGFIAVVVAAILIALATGGDNDDTATVVGDPAVQAAGDSSDDAQPEADESSDGVARADSATEQAASEPAMFGEGGGWLVPWNDGFLRIDVVFEPQVLPEFDGSFEDLIPPEVVDTLLEAGATTIEEAMDILVDAGLYDQVAEVVAANPAMADWLFGVVPPAPRFAVSQSSDGLDWAQLEGVSIPGGESIVWVQSDSERLIVGSQEYEEVDDTGRSSSTIQVAISSDLRDWEIHDITGTAGENVPDLVQVDTSIGGIAIGPDGWLAATNTYAFIDEWALLPDEIRDIDGWWELTADESGLTVDIFEQDFELVHDDEGNVIEEVPNEDCCDVVETRLLSWDEVGTDYATWQQYHEGGNDSMTVWAAAWGAAPVDTAVQGYGSFGSIAGTDAGFLAVSWTEEAHGNVLLFSPDGRLWTEVASPAGADTWIDQVVAVEGGVIATVSGPTGQMVLLGDGDGTNWEEVDAPNIPDNTWIWFNPGSGPAAIVDATDYGVFEECVDITATVFVEIDLPDHLIFIESWPDGTSLFIEDHANNAFIDAYSDLPYPELTPEFMLFDDATGEVAFLDSETGEEVVRMPTDEFLAAWDQAAAHAEEGVSECAVAAESVPFPEADFWLAATNDGRTWLVEDLDEGGGEMEPYPQQAAINGTAVVARIGDNWSRHTVG